MYKTPLQQFGTSRGTVKLAPLTRAVVNYLFSEKGREEHPEFRARLGTRDFNYTLEFPPGSGREIMISNTQPSNLEKKVVVEIVDAK